MIEAKITRLQEMIERIIRAAQRLVRVECDDVDLTPPQTFLLRALDVQGAMTLGELRRHFNAAQSTMSEMVGRLLPAIGRETLSQVVLEAVMPMAEKLADTPITLVLNPSARLRSRRCWSRRPACR